MKYILALILVSSLSHAQERQYETNTVAVETPKVESELKAKFINETQITLGEYAPVKGSNPDCLDGELAILEVDNSLTLMLGARPIAAGIGGAEKSSDENGGCNYTYEIHQDGNKITGLDTQECPPKKLTFHTNIEIQKDQLTYTKDIVEGEKVNSTITCTVKKVPDVKPVQTKKSKVSTKTPAKTGAKIVPVKKAVKK